MLDIQKSLSFRQKCLSQTPKTSRWTAETRHQQPPSHFQLTRTLFFLLTIVSIPHHFSGPVLAKIILPPSQIVQLWIQFYPHDLEKAAILITPQMRDGRSLEQWVENEKNMLASLHLRYLGGKVDSETITGNSAVVLLRAHTMTRIGEFRQIERYRLRKQTEGDWLIDSMEVVESQPLNP